VPVDVIEDALATLDESHVTEFENQIGHNVDFYSESL
jgi:hypothetical protein